MDQNEFYHYTIPKINVFNQSLPYFASKENQTLYVMVPTVKSIPLNPVHESSGKTEAYFNEEEILPDFRCKICNITIFNYSDFNIHQQEHDKNSKMYLFSENNQIQGLEIENSRSKSDLYKNIKTEGLPDPDSSKRGFDTAAINTSADLMPENKAFSFKTSSNSLPIDYRRPQFSSESFVTLHKSTTPLNALKVSIAAKSEKPLEIQSKKLDSEIQISNGIKLPFTQTLNKWGDCALISESPNPTEVVFNSDKETFEENLVINNGIMNSSLTNNLNFPNIPRQKCLVRNNNIPTVEPSFSNISPTLTYTSCKELSTTSDMPNIASSNLLHSLLRQNTKGNTESSLGEVFPESIPEKGTSQLINKFINSAPTIRSLDDMSKSAVFTYSKTKIFKECNMRNKTEKFSKNSLSNIRPLKSEKQNDSVALNILEPLDNAKRKGLYCFLCKETFNQKSEIRKHFASMQHKKFMCCVLCKSSFSSLSGLRKHLMMFHCESKDRRECSYCGYKCFQNSDLEKHTARRHTRDFKYKCNYCIKGFPTPKELKNHLTRKH